MAPPYADIECRWSRQKSLRPARCYQHVDAGPWQVVTLITGSKRRSLLMAGDANEMFMTRSLNVTSKTTEQHLVVCRDKSVSYINVSNNKRLRSTFCTIEANYWQTRSIAWPLCDSRATCYYNTHETSDSSEYRDCVMYFRSEYKGVNIKLTLLVYLLFTGTHTQSIYNYQVC